MPPGSTSSMTRLYVLNVLNDENWSRVMRGSSMTAKLQLAIRNMIHITYENYDHYHTE